MNRTTYRVRIPDDVVSLIRGLHPHIKKKVRQAFDAICTDPLSGKALKDELVGLMSYRIGRFRVICRIGKGKIIEIIAVGPRKRIYEETFRIISKEP